MATGENPPAGKKETKEVRKTEKRIGKMNKDQPKGDHQKGKPA